MPTTNRALFDAELVAVTRLRAQLDSSIDVATTLGDALPAVTVDLAGGAPLVEGVIGEPRLAVNAWADTRAAAELLCRQAVAALVTMTGSDPGYVAGGVQVLRGRTVMQPVYSFDPVAQKPRYTATVALAARATL